MYPSRRGFTLMEILIVMLITAILATIGYTSYANTQKKGRDNKRKTDLAQMQRALEAYINDYGTYPRSDAEGRILGCEDGTTACQWGESFATHVGEENETVYLAKLPKDTTHTLSYTYEFVEPNGYRIYSRLENTKDLDVAKQADGTAGTYDKQCGATYCNYVVTSENVSVPIGQLIIVTVTPTQSPTPTIPVCKNDGESCTLASDCCTNTCSTVYLDQDNDGYGTGAAIKRCGTTPSGYATNNTDCYDQNANARPGSTYCGTVNRGDGSFDYNCNNTQSTCGTIYYSVSATPNQCCGCKPCKGYTRGAGVNCGATGNISSYTDVGTSAMFGNYTDGVWQAECINKTGCYAYTRGAAGKQGCQ